MYQDSLISVAFDESMKAVMDNEEQMEAVRQAVSCLLYTSILNLLLNE